MALSHMEQHADVRFAVNHCGSDGVQVNRAARIMTAETHASFLSAKDMLARAQQLADETVAAAQAGYQDACERGYRDGVEKARRQATHDNIQLSFSRRSSMEQLEQDLNALVLQTLRQMIGEIDAADRVSMLVREALARLGRLQGDITLYIHPDLTEQVASRLQQWNAVHEACNLKTVADPALNPDACRVVCNSGCVEGDIEQQLAALESALGGCSPDIEADNISSDAAMTEMHSSPTNPMSPPC